MPFFVMMIAQYRIQLPFGQLTVSSYSGEIVGIKLAKISDELTEPSPVIEAAIIQLQAYFDNKNSHWILPLAERGTSFQRQVWHRIQQIPYGETCYYSEIAQELVTSARAVGNACLANPFLIAVPCHRVINKSGLTSDYGKIAGSDLTVKQWLLNYEKN